MVSGSTQVESACAVPTMFRRVAGLKFIAAIAMIPILIILAATPPIIRLPYGNKSLWYRNLQFEKGIATSMRPPPGPSTLSNPPKDLLMPELKNYLPNAYLYSNRSAPYDRSVLTYLHNPKSGGTSMRSCIVSLSKAAGKPTPVLVSTATVSEVRTKRLNHSTDVNDYYMGDASIGMCDFVDGRPCSYFTMMREPYDRSVSHYYFCKSGGQSWPRCNNTLEEFTLSICSLFFRQMTMQLSCGHEIEGDDSLPWNCHDHPVTIDHGRHRPQERAATLEYILKNVDKIFAVVGVTEDYETSLKLFEHAFGDPFYELCSNNHFNTGSYSANVGDRERGGKKDKERIRAEAKERLMKNKKVRKCLHEDIQIYRRVLEIFEMEKQILKAT